MRTILSIFILTIFVGKVQAQLNDYKYIVVPTRFDSFKQQNQHSTSTLVKYLFVKKGFNVVYDDALPDELYANRCLGLTVRLDDNSTMFSTKCTLVLVDCRGTEVFVTQEGKSKLKVFKEAYTESITKAFSSFDTVAYNYNGRGETQEPVTVSFKNDVKTLKDSNTGQNPVVQQKATIDEQSYKNLEPVASDYTKKETSKVTEQVATTEEQLYKSKEPEESDMVKETAATVEAVDATEISSSQVLYAQEISNGYQLVDSTPKIVLKIFNTAVPDVYTAKVEKGNGVVYKKDGKWFFEYYVGEEQTVKELNIKF